MPGSRRTARALLAAAVLLLAAATALLLTQSGLWPSHLFPANGRPDAPIDLPPPPAPDGPASGAPPFPAAGDPPPGPPLPSPPLEGSSPVAPLPPPTTGEAVAGEPLLIPVDGVGPDDLYSSFAEPRNTRPHEAIDIMAPRGTPVRAVADGRIAKLFTSEPGGLTIYQFDRDERVAYYYAHLDRYEAGVAEGLEVRRGDLIGYVGSTGNASDDAPHLHFAVLVLGPEKRWWEGQPIDPYPLLGGR